MKKQYRAFMFCGMTEGGGCAEFGEWRNSYAQAEQDGTQNRFMPPYSDGYTGIECQELRQKQPRKKNRA